MERPGITSDTEHLDYALAKVALEHAFGPKTLARKGRVAEGVDLEQRHRAAVLPSILLAAG